jgi:hypothetical protein
VSFLSLHVPFRSPCGPIATQLSFSDFPLHASTIACWNCCLCASVIFPNPGLFLGLYERLPAGALPVFATLPVLSGLVGKVFTALLVHPAIIKASITKDNIIIVFMMNRS